MMEGTLKNAPFVLLVCLLTLTSCRDGGTSEREGRARVREPVFAGSWYPADSSDLRQMVTEYLKTAERRDVDGKIVALWVPHAGYPFSGRIAALGFKQLEGKAFETVVVVGPSHRYYFEGISVFDRGFYKTPLGLIPIDTVMADQLKSASDNIYYRPKAHAAEHSVEVQLPFLQQILGGFKLVPVILGSASLDDIKDFAEALTDMLGTQKRLLVLSADLSHYHGYDRARELDLAGLEAVKNLDAEDLAEKLNSGETEIDAPGAALAMIMAVRGLGAEEAVLLEYANSGDVSGDKARVVGYGALAIAVPGSPGSKLTGEARRELLRIARESVEAVVLGRTGPNLDTEDPLLKANCGAFVTIEKKGELRGCIGYVLPTMPLYQAVSQAAVSAATKDNRFPPVSSEELDEVRLEISVLTQPRLIKEVEDIQVGRDGLIVRKGRFSGLLLPQVASSRGWDRQTFLEETCRKAGLPRDAWKEGAQVYAFSAVVFGEH
jgi:AmmeMemoRadiSam system protein B/AmmeMemoRadiSam system protein A